MNKFKVGDRVISKNKLEKGKIVQVFEKQDWMPETVYTVEWITRTVAANWPEHNLEKIEEPNFKFKISDKVKVVDADGKINVVTIVNRFISDSRIEMYDVRIINLVISIPVEHLFEYKEPKFKVGDKVRVNGYERLYYGKISAVLNRKIHFQEYLVDIDGAQSNGFCYVEQEIKPDDRSPEFKFKVGDYVTVNGESVGKIISIHPTYENQYKVEFGSKLNRFYKERDLKFFDRELLLL